MPPSEVTPLRLKRAPPREIAAVSSGVTLAPPTSLLRIRRCDVFSPSRLLVVRLLTAWLLAGLLLQRPPAPVCSLPGGPTGAGAGAAAAAGAIPGKGE